MRPAPAPSDESPGWPAVSVIMAVRNDVPYLRETLERVLSQGYPGTLEVIVAVGPSHDDTHDVVAAVAATDPRVRLVDNPVGTTASGLNAALAQARHDVVVRVDARGRLTPDYVRRAVEILAETGADNVGGVFAARGETPLEHAIARAMTTWLGIGSSRGRFDAKGTAGPVDTVYLGVFRRAVLDRLGGYDESLVRGEDWELNYRIRQAGGTVWYDPRLRVDYRPRPTVAAFVEQFYSNGRWRRAICRRHPGTCSARYLAAPLTMVVCAAAALVAACGALVGVPTLSAALVLPAGYVLLVTAGAAVVSRDLPWRARLWLPVVVSMIHFAWALGFLTSREKPHVTGPGQVGQRHRHDQTKCGRESADRARPDHTSLDDTCLGQPDLAQASLDQSSLDQSSTVSVE